MPSLSITWQNGQTLLHCHAGCETQLILDAIQLRMADLWDDPTPPKRDSAASPRRRPRPTPSPRTPTKKAAASRLGRPTSGWHKVAEYIYADERGQPLGLVVRKERNYQLGRAKSFSQKHMVDGRWEDGAPERKVLYRLPEVRAAIAAGSPVFLVEGEKDADSVVAQGMCATTNASGSENWHPDLTLQLAGADLVIVADRDGPGYKRALRLLNDLEPVAHAVRAVEPAEGKDVTDHLQAGRSLQDLLPLDQPLLTVRLATAKRLPLYIATSEQDRLALTHAGACALAWDEEITPLLEGVDVTITAPKDPDGQRAAQAILDELSRVVSSIRAVEPTAGPTTAAHLAAGGTLDDLRPALRLLAGSGDGDGAGRSGDDLGGYPLEEPNNKPRYIVRHGELVLARINRKEKLEFHTVLGCVARIVRIEQRASLIDPDEPPVTVGYVLELTHPAAPDQSVELRVTRDAFAKGSWLEDLPWPGIAYDSSRNGLAKVRDGIRMTSPVAEVVILHQGPGWVTTPTGDVYVHAGGGIGVNGPVSMPTRFPSKLAHYCMPPPPTKASDLREAAQHSIGLLTLLPPRIGAPLAGAAYRSVISRMPPALLLLGGPGSLKTSMAKVALHHVAPDLPFDASLLSMSERGATINAGAKTLYLARHTLMLADDGAPDRSMRAAAERVAGYLRLQYNGESRDRLDREAELREPTPPQGSLIATSEVGPSSASANERALTIPFHKGEIDQATREILWGTQSRHGRGHLTASFVRWIAGRREEVLSRLDTLLVDYARQWRDHGCPDRVAETLANLAAGWRLQLDHLVDQGAYSVDEADDIWRRAWDGLAAAGEAQADPDAPTDPGSRALQLIGALMRARIAGVTDRHGNPPTAELAVRYGWSPDPAPRPDRVATFQRPGKLIGCYVDTEQGRRLYLDPDLTLAAIRLLTSQLGEPFEETTNSLAAALSQKDGVLATRTHQGKMRRTLPRTMPGGNRARVWDIAETAVFPDPGDDDPGNVAPSPTAPGPDTPCTDHPAEPHLSKNDEHPGTGRDDEEAPDPCSTGATPPPPETVASLQEDDVMPQPDLQLAAERAATCHMEVVETPQPCVTCGLRCVLRIDGVFLHAGCPTPEAATGSAISADLGKTEPETGAQSPASAPAHPTSSSEATPRWRAPAAVVDASGIYLPGGEVLPLPEPCAHAGHIAALTSRLRLGWGGDKRTYPDAGQLWLTPAFLASLGLPTELPQRIAEARAVLVEALTHPFFTEATSDGWQLGAGARDQLGPWLRVWKEKESAHLVFIPVVQASLDTLLDDDPHPAALTQRLLRYAETVTIPFRVSAARTSQDLIKRMDASRKLVVTEPAEPPPPAEFHLEGDLRWHRPPTTEEARCRYVHAYDTPAMYLPAASHAKLGLGTAEHLETPQLDPKMPGYWLARVPAWDDRMLPDPWRTRDAPRGDGARWLTTPTLQLGLELFDLQPSEIEIVEAYVWPVSTTYLEKWGKTIDTARLTFLRQAQNGDSEAELLEDAVKELYKAGVGLFRSKYIVGDIYHRPDWQHHIIAASRANLIRKMVKVVATCGRHPLAVDVDNVLYASDDPNPVTAMPAPLKYGFELGKVKHGGSGYMAELGPLLERRTPFGFGRLTTDWDPITGVPRGKTDTTTTS
ncbi:hypothetical protein OHA25_60145 (plasmid) [Nonomuraea sp. NBC_00507]|uniref:hypothetical protein n=1 Tax=Nonomuraea sp. NBC_00507 TaxID=2976002 RepID=UPI002E1855EC